jgi:hypothetical protein
MNIRSPLLYGESEQSVCIGGYRRVMGSRRNSVNGVDFLHIWVLFFDQLAPQGAKASP